MTSYQIKCLRAIELQSCLATNRYGTHDRRCYNSHPTSPRDHHMDRQIPEAYAWQKKWR